MRAFVRLLALVAALLLPSAATRADSYGEYPLKAAYLYRFAQYIEWPESSFSSPSEAFTLCVLGKDPFGASLKELGMRKVRTRGIALLQLNNIGAARGCHLVYGEEIGPRELPELLRVLNHQPVLLVSSTEGFAAAGGGIGFVIDDGRLRIEINLDTLRQANLKADAKLLEVASRRIQASGGRP